MNGLRQYPLMASKAGSPLTGGHLARTVASSGPSSKETRQMGLMRIDLDKRHNRLADCRSRGIGRAAAMLALLQLRYGVMKFRTAPVNQIRGILYESGIAFKKGGLAGFSEIRRRTADIESDV